jgi:hypothetical protein
MPGVSAHGADALLAVSKRLKAAGETELRKELHKAMRGAARPLIPKVRESARRALPTHGGLNERIARKPYRAQVRTGARTAGVRITGTKVDPRINQGRVAHPVFGRPNSTVVQRVPGAVGYFDKPLAQSGAQVRGDLVTTLGRFVERLARG